MMRMNSSGWNRTTVSGLGPMYEGDLLDGAGRTIRVRVPASRVCVAPRWSNWSDTPAENFVEPLRRGDAIRVSRWGGLYHHHGIYVGDGEVIHYSGEVARKSNAMVRSDRLGVFAADGAIELVEHADAASPTTIVSRARTKVGRREYSLLANNCEHFVSWCVSGVHGSEQIDDLRSAGIGAAGSATAVAFAGPVSVALGLETIGAAIGLGAAAGLAMLSSAPTAMVVLAANRVLSDRPSLPAREREARASARAAVAGTGVSATMATGMIAAAVGSTGLGVSTLVAATALSAVVTALIGGIALRAARR